MLQTNNTEYLMSLNKKAASPDIQNNKNYDANIQSIMEEHKRVESEYEKLKRYQ
jgi:hypothetical protein